MNATFTYNLRIVKGHPFIMIVDTDQGKSVTNDIENVVSTICKKEKINPVEHTIIYQDSQGNWDGYIFSTKTFFPLRERHWLKAATKYIKEYE